MKSRQNTNPWGDAANQAVGALYKYYASMPSEADKVKMQLQNAQLQEMQHGQQMGDFTMQNLSPEIRNDIYRRKLESNHDTSGAQIFGTYVNKPMQVDAGDSKYIVDGGTGLPMQQYGVGVAPATTVDKEGGRLITTPAMPSQIRPPMPSAGGGASPMADMLGAALGGAGIPPVSMEELNAPQPRMKVNPMPLPPGAENLDPMAEWQGAVNGMPQSPATGPVGGTVRAAPQQPAPQTTVGADGMMVTQLPDTPDAALKTHDKNQSINASTDDLNNTFSSALANIEKGGAGIGSYAKDIPFAGGQTSAAYLQADLGKITSKAALDKIAQLKEESKTGGFFGNLSDGERQAVADSQLAIRQTMDPQELAYRLMMHKDIVNDIVNGRGRVIPGTNQVVPMDAGQPRSGLPTMTDIEKAQTPEQLMHMWDAFDKYPVFKGRPPQAIDDALAQKMNQLRGVQ